MQQAPWVAAVAAVATAVAAGAVAEAAAVAAVAAVPAAVAAGAVAEAARLALRRAAAPAPAPPRDLAISRDAGVSAAVPDVIPQPRSLAPSAGLGLGTLAPTLFGWGITGHANLVLSSLSPPRKPTDYTAVGSYRAVVVPDPTADRLYRLYSCHMPLASHDLIQEYVQPTRDLCIDGHHTNN